MAPATPPFQHGSYCYITVYLLLPPHVGVLRSRAYGVSASPSAYLVQDMCSLQERVGMLIPWDYYDRIANVNELIKK